MGRDVQNMADAKQQEIKSEEKMQGGSAKGQVQKAMGQILAVDNLWEQIGSLEPLQEEFGPMLEQLTPAETKLLGVATMIPLLRKKVEANPAALTAKKAGNLNMYRNAAEKCGIKWREEAAALESRGIEVWEAEREALLDQGLVVPDYYVYGGQGPLHSYDQGNCNWEAAFDCKPAFELVHMHHFPELSPTACMAELHARMDNAALEAIQCEGGVKKVLDVGCGVGTSTYSLRTSLDRHGMQDAHVLACDLSSHFIAVAQYRQHEGDMKSFGWGEDKLSFKHGDGLQLSRLGVEPESYELVMLAKLSHETPAHVWTSLVQAGVKALRPGGVIAYVDVNALQILKNNPVSNLANRVAISNEPFFDQFLAVDLHKEFEAAGMEVVADLPSNPDKWPELEDAPVRVMVARKPL